MEAKIQISEEELEPVVRRLLVKLLAEESGQGARSDDELTANDVARIKGVTARTVRDWVKQGRIPHHRTPSGQFRFYRRHVDAPLSAV
ncbi:MAG TPA: helix-turn-helix domain-containing protein [Pyrinomonadaceae bacterium]|jgi:excisionase family DNA binding protein|nr:helix-turn-helix domain-containing protein [Pyrinomonadaceae bacterium]